MFYRRFALLILVLVLFFLLIFPGVILAENTSPQDTTSYTLVIEVPEQIEAGQTLTLVAHIKENRYDEPVPNARVYFFVKSDFFINGLVDIGNAITDEQGIAKLDYISNQPGVLMVLASYKAENSSKPIEVERKVNITGSTKSIYQNKVGIDFPNGLLLWIIAIVFVLFAVWGTFLYVLYQVQYVSRGTGAGAAPFIFIVVVAVLFTVIVMILVTPEAQYNFSFLP